MNKNKLKNLIIIFIVGGFGGLLLSNVIFPKLAGFAVFSDVNWMKGDQTVIVNKTEEINIQEAEILGEVIKKNKESLVVIKTFRNGAFLSSGTGFVVSSDGLILTRREVVSGSQNKITIDRGEDTFDAEILKRLDDHGLLLLKSDASNLPVVSFADTSAISLGNKVFLIGKKQGALGSIDFINVGIIKSVDDLLLETNIKEDINLSSGTPLLNLKGDVLGINFANSNGYVFSVSSSIIQDFIY